MPMKFDDITISNEVVLLDDGSGCSFWASDDTTIATTESTETVGMTNYLNILTDKSMSEPKDNINAKIDSEHVILNSSFDRNHSDDRCENNDIDSKGTDESVLNQNDIKIKDDRLMEHNEGRHSQEAFRAEDVCQIRTKEISEISHNVILNNSDKLVKTEENAKDNNSVVTQKTDESLNIKVDNKLDSGIKENSKENIEANNYLCCFTHYLYNKMP
ncbi:unnamed protein product [Psylliodes chrysocephalus]|uniref:Uncharacterized protein n=1 Tax=Psylliodes chrysocephalus TaxID=3402493 RepID=A0A9P0CYF5_9CUCU|nr:unnamed protein product [Psylliodes chrysocephala]